MWAQERAVTAKKTEEWRKSGRVSGCVCVCVCDVFGRISQSQEMQL